MKAECPNCHAAYQVAESKIPPNGAYATCAKCGTRFHIKNPKAQNGESEQEIITCPKCGHVNTSSVICAKCGIVFSKYYEAQETTDESQRDIMANGKTESKKITKLLMSQGQKTVFVFVIVLVITSTISFYLGRYFPVEKQGEKSGVVIETNTQENVSNTIDKQFGWGKADSNINIEAVELVKGVVIKQYSDYTHPMPAIQFAIRNNGEEGLDSFGIGCYFTDMDNKRKLGGFARASGSVEPGWTSKKEVFYLQSYDYYRHLGGDIPIDFKILGRIYAKTKSGDKILYETVFQPYELELLPKLN